MLAWTVGLNDLEDQIREVSRHLDYTTPQRKEDSQKLEGLLNFLGDLAEAMKAGETVTLTRGEEE